jgi:GNAT superfamily N-acetyltransferase
MECCRIWMIELSMSVIVRRAAPEDAQQITEILLRSFEEFRPLYTEGGFHATTPAAEIIRARIETEGPSWVATIGDETVGTVSAVKRGGGLYVRSMGVLPSERGKGIAASLLATVEAYAAEQGIRVLTLTTTPFLDSAIRLYERYGFAKTGLTDLEGTPLFAMRKEL